ncbi:MAG: hypothetical protein KKA07_09720, partial [Bacteroidetes bacterium]|nr:hypothetical protein [Bacteroidota bacterium]
MGYAKIEGVYQMNEKQSVLLTSPFSSISERIIAGERITPEEAAILFAEADLSLLSYLATTVKRRISGESVFYNRNFHVEPSNICRFHCRFCSFRKSSEKGYLLSVDEVLDKIKSLYTG